MAEKNFAVTPSVSISRSKFLRTSTHKTTFNLGEIVPIYVDEVLPGDTRSIDVASLIRMSTPITPIMDDIEMELFAFFVPNRIVWKDWKQFMGESPSAGYSAWNGTFPFVKNLKAATSDRLIHYMGGATPIGMDDNEGVSALPLRGYLAIYNRWFRDQNVEGPCFIDDTDGEDASTDSAGNAFTYNSKPLIAYKKSDYFTRALPYAQKGNPVVLPLGTIAPIIGDASLHALGTNGLKIGQANLGALGGTLAADAVGKVQTTGTAATGSTYVGSTNLVADLSQATAATINQLREAFQLQKLLEKDALYGTRYWELLYGHFGVRSPDATLQDPEYLGGTKFMINIEQVLQTTGYNSNPAINTLGTPGANSVTGNKGALFTKSFCEHGHLFILAVARQSKHTYGQGLSPMWKRFDRYDYYWPEFANLGAREIVAREIFYRGPSNIDLLPFGYQEAWAEYRYKPSHVSGLFAPFNTNNLGTWTLSEDFQGLPTLSPSFLKVDRSNLARCLVTGTTGPDFLCDFYFRDTAVRPLPMFSIPGLVDHH